MRVMMSTGKADKAHRDRGAFCHEGLQQEHSEKEAHGHSQHAAGCCLGRVAKGCRCVRAPAAVGLRANAQARCNPGRCACIAACLHMLQTAARACSMWCAAAGVSLDLRATVWRLVLSKPRAPGRAPCRRTALALMQASAHARRSTCFSLAAAPPDEGDSAQDVEHEIRIMKMMDHPNCVKLYEVRQLASSRVLACRSLSCSHTPPTMPCVSLPFVALLSTIY